MLSFREIDLGYDKVDRLAWYRVSSFISNMAKAQESLGVKEVVNIGGGGIYCWLLSVAGASAVTNFRGTHDLDLVSFAQGKFRNLLGAMKDMGGLEHWERRHSHGFEDKQTYDVELGGSNGDGVSGQLKVDMFSNRSGMVRFCDRRLSLNRMVSDPPVVLTNLDGTVVVPSLFDSFIFKADIMLNRNGGLRNKDKSDILALLMIGSQFGSKINDFLERMLQDDVNINLSAIKTEKKLHGLGNMFKEADIRGLKMGADGMKIVQKYLA